MLDRQKRLNEVYEHLHNYFSIHTKGEFADSVKYARAYISSALNGNAKYLTDKLFTNICEAFPGVFDLNYLLTGEGSLLSMEEEVQNDNNKKLVKAKETVDMMELYAQRIRLVDDLRISLKDELAEVRLIRAELQQARNDFRDATYRLTQALDKISTQTPINFAAEQQNSPNVSPCTTTNISNP